MNDITMGEICNTLRGVPAPDMGVGCLWRKGSAIPNLKVILEENRSFDQVLRTGSLIRRQWSANFVSGQPNRPDFGQIGFRFGIAGRVLGKQQLMLYNVFLA